MSEYIIDTDGYYEISIGTVERDGIPIVRCADCEYSTEEGITSECYFCHLDRWNTNPIEASPVEPYGFCAWGKVEK